MVIRPVGLSSAPLALLRGALALALLLGALRLFFPPYPIDGPALLLAWLAVAAGLGVVLARRQAFWLALLYLPFAGAGHWYATWTGPWYLSSGETPPLDAFLLSGLLGIPLGLLGVALGLGVAAGLARLQKRFRGMPPRAAERLLPLAVLVLALGGATLDWATGGRFVSRPRPVELAFALDRYSDEDVRTLTTGLAFTVYVAPPGEGRPTEIRRLPGSSAEMVQLTYCDSRCSRGSRVDVMSASPGFGFGGDATTEAVEIAGVIWQVRGGALPFSPVVASTAIGDTAVGINAPSRARFERVAAGLRRVDR